MQFSICTFFLRKEKKICLVIVFRQFSKATNYGKCVKRYGDLVLSSHVIEILQKLSKLVYISLYRKQGRHNYRTLFKSLCLVIVFRQFSKATNFGKCVKRYGSLVLSSYLIENLQKLSKLVYISLYRKQGRHNYRTLFKQTILKHRYTWCKSNESSICCNSFTPFLIIYHFIGDTKCGTRCGCQLLKGSFTLKCRRKAQ